MTFDLNVFTERTSTFIFSFIGFAAVLVICSAILNISINISLIADSQIQDISEIGISFISKKFIVTILGIVVAVVAFLFLGDNGLLDFLVKFQKGEGLVRVEGKLSFLNTRLVLRGQEAGNGK